MQKGKELNDFQRNPLDIEILSNLRFGSLEIRDTSVTRVTNNNTFDPTKEADDLETHSNNMDRWTLLVKDCASCPTGSKRKGGYIASTPRRKLTMSRLSVAGKLALLENTGKILN